MTRPATRFSGTGTRCIAIDPGRVFDSSPDLEVARGGRRVLADRESIKLTVTP
jgi:hypothetical protein